MSITHMRALPVLFVASLGLSASGCTSALFSNMDFKPAMLDGFGTEQRIITQFTDARSEDNESAFRRVVSTRFEKKALRAPDAYKDLEILSLPKTPLEVVESTQAEDKSLTVVAKEESGTKYQFQLVRDPEKRHWVVDDVLIRQQKKGTRASKSTVEVMDLLLTVREFLDIWKAGERESVLLAVSNDLREPLSSLPESWLQRLIGRVASEYESGMARRPEAQLNESDAVVKMPSKSGFLLMKVVRDDDRWLVSDIEVRLRKTEEHPGSLLRQARALNTVTQFLTAYEANDTTSLQSLSETGFYESALSIGDLSLIRLPKADDAPDDFEMRSFSGQLTVIIPGETEIVRIALTSADGSGKPIERKSETPTVEMRFAVADVTLFDRETQRQKNLRSAFTAPARAQLFLISLQERDLAMVRRLSSIQLCESAWSQISPELFSRLSMDRLPTGTMTLQDNVVRGDTTELEFLAGDGRICGVVMKDENGSLQVDDVQFPDADARVSSLRTQLMLTAPLSELADAWQRNDLTTVQKHTSMEFNRLVWSNVNQLPTGFERLPQLLTAPVMRIEATDDDALVQLGTSGQSPVTIRLAKEHTAWVVDEISMTQPDGSMFDVRKTLRHDIAQRVLNDPTGGITRAMYSAKTETPDTGVTQANHTSDTSHRGNLTLPSKAQPKPRQSANRAAGLDLTEPDPVMPRPRADKSGTLHYGPDAGSRSARPDSVSAPAAAAEYESAATTTDTNDGVIYFQGAPSDAAADDAVETIDDLSDHPIEIPME